MDAANNESEKPVEVARGLLRTAAEFPRSKVGEHLQPLVMRREEGLTREEVLGKLREFASAMHSETGDPAWNEVVLALSPRDGAEVNQAISAAAGEFLDRISSDPK